MPVDAEIEIVTEPDADLSRGLVVVGIPTLGLVGTITTHYLIDQLEMPQVGGIYSPRFPPVSRVTDGRSSLPVRLHTIEAQCGPGHACERLVTVVTEFLPGPETLHRFSDALTRWAIEQDAKLLLVPDGLMIGGEEGPTVRGVAARQGGLAPLTKLGVEPIDGGVLMGVSAAMLAQGERLGADTVSLLAESAPDHPDARAAARLVEVLDKIVPEIDIETAPLIEEAERIEQQLQAVRTQVEQQAGQHEHPGYDQMYQ